ncbi:MAG: hypothetical protein RIB70_06885 [Roseitalea porphyridii]
MTLGISGGYPQEFCQKPSLSGVEDFKAITIRRSIYAASRSAHVSALTLSRFAESSPFIDDIRAAIEKIVARPVTAVARSKPQQDARLVIRRTVLLEKVA